MQPSEGNRADSIFAIETVVESSDHGDDPASMDRQSISDSSAGHSLGKDLRDGRAVRRSHVHPTTPSQSENPFNEEVEMTAFPVPQPLPSDAEYSRHRPSTLPAASAPGLPTPDDRDTSGKESINFTSTALEPAVRIAQFEVDDRAETSSFERRRFSHKRYIHFAAICWVVFVNGWNDGTTGPMLPRIQEYYGVRAHSCVRGALLRP